VWLALTNVDPNRPAQIELAADGATRAAGQILSAPKIDSVNTFEAPSTVAPRAMAVRASGGRISLKLAPQSIAVVALER
jgi:alpha-N-arabinofuranosidase